MVAGKRNEDLFPRDGPLRPLESLFQQRPSAEERAKLLRTIIATDQFRQGPEAHPVAASQNHAPTVPATVYVPEAGDDGQHWYRSRLALREVCEHFLRNTSANVQLCVSRHWIPLRSL